jgi:hypothetical protein
MEHKLERGKKRGAVEVTDHPVGIGGGARVCHLVGSAVTPAVDFPSLTTLPSRSVRVSGGVAANLVI